MKNKVLALSLTFLMFSLSEAQSSVAPNGNEVDPLSVSNYAELLWTVSGNITQKDYASCSGAAAWASPSTEVWGDDYQVGSHTSYDDASVEIPLGSTTYTAAKSFGQTSLGNLYSESTVLLDPSSYGEYFAYASAQQTFKYLVAANGDIKYTVTFDMWFDSIGSEYEENEAWAWSYLELWNTNGWVVIEGTSRELTSGSGTLDVSYYALAGSWIQLQFGVETHASLLNPNPVPVPPSVLMLLTGCTSFFFMRRRKS